MGIKCKVFCGSVGNSDPIGERSFDAVPRIGEHISLLATDPNPPTEHRVNRVVHYPTDFSTLDHPTIHIFVDGVSS